MSNQIQKQEFQRVFGNSIWLGSEFFFFFCFKQSGNVIVRDRAWSVVGAAYATLLDVNQKMEAMLVEHVKVYSIFDSIVKWSNGIHSSPFINYDQIIKHKLCGFLRAYQMWCIANFEYSLIHFQKLQTLHFKMCVCRIWAK